MEGGDADLLVYDTTSAAVPISVRGRHVIVTAPDTGKGRIVIEVYELSNDTSVTRIAGTPEKATFATTLPEGAFDPVATDGDVPAEAVKFENGRALVFAPIAPGVKQLSFHYRVPLNKAPIAIPLLAPAAVLEVLVEDTQGDASGAKPEEDGVRESRGAPVQAVSRRRMHRRMQVVTVLAPTRTVVGARVLHFCAHGDGDRCDRRGDARGARREPDAKGSACCGRGGDGRRGSGRYCASDRGAR